jgi:hypothetical protein
LETSRAKTDKTGNYRKLLENLGNYWKLLEIPARHSLPNAAPSRQHKAMTLKIPIGYALAGPFA